MLNFQLKTERGHADFETCPLSYAHYLRLVGFFPAAIPPESHPCGARSALRREVCLSKSGAKVLLFSEIRK